MAVHASIDRPNGPTGNLPDVSVVRCNTCRQHIEWLTTRFGRAPFDHPLVPVDQLGGRQGWLISRVTIRGQERAVAVPMEYCNPTKRAAARWVLVRHECPGPPD